MSLSKSAPLAGLVLALALGGSHAQGAVRSFSGTSTFDGPTASGPYQDIYAALLNPQSQNVAAFSFTFDESSKLGLDPSLYTISHFKLSLNGTTLFDASPAQDGAYVLVDSTGGLDNFGIFLYDTAFSAPGVPGATLLQFYVLVALDGGTAPNGDVPPLSDFTGHIQHAETALSLSTIAPYPDGVVSYVGVMGNEYTLTEDSAAPEPATWALMIVGFGFAGAALRRGRAALA